MRFRAERVMQPGGKRGNMGRAVWGRWCLPLLVGNLLLPLGSGSVLAQRAERDGLEVENLQVEHPVVTSLRQSKPQEPDEWMYAIETLLTLGEQQLAIEFANTLASMDLEEKALVDLGLAVGSARLLRLATNDTLGEEPQKFARRVLAAVRNFRRDPQRLEKLALRAAQSAGRERVEAITDLRLAGGAAVQPLVRLLLDPGQAGSAARIRDALAGLGPSVVAPLLAVLQTEDEQLQAQVLLTLARLGDLSTLYDVLCHAAMPSTGAVHRGAARRATAALIERVPDTGSVKRKVYTVIHHYLTGRRRPAADLEGKAPLWNWDDDRRVLEQSDQPLRLVAAARADQLARQLYRVDPQDRRLARLAALARLNRAKLFAGLDQPLTAAVADEVRRLAPADPLDFTEQVLALALQRGEVPAAIGAAEILAEEANKAQGAPHLTDHSGPVPTPLVQALADPDRRLRFAALQAVMAAGPQTLFAGASRVPEALKFFIRCAGSPRALVADPRPERCQQLSVLLEENGWQSDRFLTGRRMALAATQRADYAVALVAFTIEQPDCRETLARLRQDPRTADLPVGLIVEPRHRLAAERLVDRFPLTEAFVAPRDGSTLQMQLDRLIAKAGDRFVPHQRRTEHATAAVELLAQLSRERSPLFELAGFEPVLELSLHNADLVAAATGVLGNIGSPAAQHALFNLASGATQPLASRQLASQAFVASVRRHGIGLSIAQIQQLSRQYDQQAGDGAKIEELLWSMLDVLQSGKR
ncbi:MAG: hypothetical protein GTO53_03815 [Planctomycetales bacterium]|nr:hypothetical protein [Planctomycetales bacterium]NIM08288.1 hypothetical protein [Planctomycetales bacterium]NIN07781.1 hypothetical protein [Planctomycetales bacterium]NIN76901.1 hypothetical protein [Planctomycetales bacterium]NIO34100.1 hypothetical protein [Planctomycetales bacterium]